MRRLNSLGIVQGLILLTLIAGMGLAAVAVWQPLPVKDDPLVRMPGTQPEQGVSLESPNRCLNCHADYNHAVEPGFNWKGSMMAQASRDPIFWACLTTAAQDAIWAVGNPNATDLCLRCHFPGGWLAGRSDPTNASLMTGSDYDGLHCDFCHRMYDPFAKATFDGTREGSDWAGYWDENGNTGPGSNTLSQTEATTTYAEDLLEQQGVPLFSGAGFFVNNEPKYATYTENLSGQYFVANGAAKRAGFADAEARHQMLYSRYHKSRNFCATCHDVSNPVLANLNNPANPDLHTEQFSASSYFHVERTWSEFTLSTYGQQGGAATNAEFQAQGAPDITWAVKCQDCHMRDVIGAGCDKKGAPIRPIGSAEHPNSGLPLHDLTGGNAWVSHILGSLDPAGPIYDVRNVEILGKGPAVLTLDLNAGESALQNGAALKAGSDRALQQLALAATIKNLSYNPSNGVLSFRVLNNAGHKLISGFPEGRRMFINIKAYTNGGTTLVGEVNPYSATAGTLKGLPHSPNSPPLGSGETRVDALVYEVHPKSSITNENETFHFVLATGRFKDNRIPPKGFDIANAAARISEPVWGGQSAPGLFTAAEYAGGYDDVTLTIPTGADYVKVALYYQGTSREYIEFLRDEINGTGHLTLPPEAYIAQTDPFFAGLRAWGNTIWDLWYHNHGLDNSGAAVPGIVPVEMAAAEYGQPAPTCNAPVPTLVSAVPGNGQVTLTWTDEHTTDPLVVGYAIYYDQAGKTQLIATVGNTTTYIDSGLTNAQQYCYKVTSRYTTCESGYSNVLCGTPSNQGQAKVGVSGVETGRYETTGQGRNKTTVFVTRTLLNVGDEVVVRAHVYDVSTQLPLAGAVVDLEITGPETIPLVTDPSDAGGVAEARWQTVSGRKNLPGTTPGQYTVTVKSVTAAGYDWDQVVKSAGFTLQ